MPFSLGLRDFAEADCLLPLRLISHCPSGLSLCTISLGMPSLARSMVPGPPFCPHRLRFYNLHIPSCQKCDPLCTCSSHTRLLNFSSRKADSLSLMAGSVSSTYPGLGPQELSRKRLFDKGGRGGNDAQIPLWEAFSLPWLSGLEPVSAVFLRPSGLPSATTQTPSHSLCMGDC